MEDQECHWDRLANEVKLHILSFLPTKNAKINDFFTYALVSTDFKALIYDHPLVKLKQICLLTK